MIEVDGSLGEGGGQVLRTALTLAMMTGEVVQVAGIRARRSKPGLMPQHLAAVQAAAVISSAHLEGAHLGSHTIMFEPHEIRPGRYEFDIGTAGSTSLVLQTIFMPLSFAGAASSVTLMGGTHVPLSPSFHYLDLQWLPSLRQMGFDGRLTLETAGFYPKGGGRVHAAIRPARAELHPLRLTERGSLRRFFGISAVANLEINIAERQREQALRGLRALQMPGFVDLARLPGSARGTMLLLLGEFAGGRCCYQALGERRKTAERVADEAVKGLAFYLEHGAAVDEYAADQLLLPLAFASGNSEIFTAKITTHLVTNAEIIRRFLPVRIEIEGEAGQPGFVRVMR